MSACAICSVQASRVSLSNSTTTVVAAFSAMTFAACGAAPTPLYHQYQEGFGLTSAMVTVIFAAYVLKFRAALLTTGSLSDHVGRRPVILGTLMLNIVAMVIFMMAGSAVALIAARSVQGFATGAATTALGAATRYRPQPRPRHQQRDRLCWPDGGKPGLSCACHLRARPNPVCLYRAPRAVGGRTDIALAYAGDNAIKIRRSRIFAPACERAYAGSERACSIDTSQHRIVGAGRLLFLVDAFAGAGRYGRHTADRWRTCGRSAYLQRGCCRAVAAQSPGTANAAGWHSCSRSRRCDHTLWRADPNSSRSCFSARLCQVWDSAPRFPARSAVSYRSPKRTNARDCCRPSMWKVTWPSACRRCLQDFLRLS